MHTCVKDVLCLVAFCLRYKAQKRSDEDPLASRRGPQGHILHGIREVAKEPSATRSENYENLLNDYRKISWRMRHPNP